MRPTRVATMAAWAPPRIAARRLNILVQSPSLVAIMWWQSLLRQQFHLRLGHEPGDDGVKGDGHQISGEHGAERREAAEAGDADADPADERGPGGEQGEGRPDQAERTVVEELLLAEDHALANQQDQRAGAQRRAGEQ